MTFQRVLVHSNACKKVVSDQVNMWRKKLELLDGQVLDTTKKKDQRQVVTCGECVRKRQNVVLNWSASYLEALRALG